MAERTPRPLAALAAALILLTCSARADAPAAAASQEWRFEARLDGRPIGEHVYRLEATPAGRVLTSQAQFAVRVLGLTVYRYRHQAREQWVGNCLAAVQADTDDDGTPLTVRADGGPAALQVRTADGAMPATPGCVMSFAYWNPSALRSQASLLNVQTGRMETVRFSSPASGTLDVRGVPVAATRLTLQLPDSAIDLWYATATDVWIGLDATLAGGRKLSYRLR
ncbi:MAG: hypothetical protein KA795_07700 [Burkholderiaceae bacterium]|nr:hypothetical protein [Burkholderiaceae bacterium]